MRADLIAEDIAILRETIRANDGANVANRAFVRKVDELIRAFYDDIGEFTALSLTDILDLFLIKVLYVNRASRDAGTLEYLSDLLRRYLLTSSLDLGQGIVPYMTDFITKTADTRGDETFEVARKYGDNALFISGVFPQNLGRKRGAGRMGGAAFVDRQYFITVGPQYYEMAARQEMARVVSLRTTLLRLAQFFDVYVDALNEMSDQYVMGDMDHCGQDAGRVQPVPKTKVAGPRGGAVKATLMRSKALRPALEEMTRTSRRILGWGCGPWVAGWGGSIPRSFDFELGACLVEVVRCLRRPGNDDRQART
jgi:hypothetical protein